MAENYTSSELILGRKDSVLTKSFMAESNIDYVGDQVLNIINELTGIHIYRELQHFEELELIMLNIYEYFINNEQIEGNNTAEQTTFLNKVTIEYLVPRFIKKMKHHTKYYLETNNWHQRGVPPPGEMTKLNYRTFKNDRYNYIPGLEDIPE